MLFGIGCCRVSRLAKERIFGMELRWRVGETEYHHMADPNARQRTRLTSELNAN